MCLIIIKKKGIKFNPKIYKYIRDSAVTNKDGFGYVIHRKDNIGGDSPNLTIRKETANLDTFIKNLMAEKVGLMDTLIIHLRKATAGVIKLSNCHPMIIANEGIHQQPINQQSVVTCRMPVVAHNGHIASFCDKEDINSDTHNFTTRFLSKKYPNKNNYTSVDIMYGLKTQCKNNMETFRAKVHKHEIFKNQKFAILDPLKGLLILGLGWKKDSHGNVFSNDSVNVKTEPMVSWEGW